MVSKRDAQHLFQDPIKEKFERAPFIKYARGDNSGLVGFQKALSEEEVAYVKENIKTINSKEVTWSLPEGLHLNSPP
jgi:lupus La protein